MDVLQYWQPNIEWAQFYQGPIRDAMWQKFRQLVQLAHARRYWASAARKERATPLAASLYSESRYMRTKRKRDREYVIREYEGHMHRAGFLAAEKISEMSHLVDYTNKGEPDWLLCIALYLTTDHRRNALTGHERARWDALAFGAFDAEREVTGTPEDMARRWLISAGYPPSEPLGVVPGAPE